MSDISKIQIGSALYDINDATARNAIEAVTLNAVNRNGIYRGKDLGTITASNVETFFSNNKISTGEFTDLYLGDTFVIQDGTYNTRYLIAGFDPRYNKGDTALTKHHIGCIPVSYVKTARMNETNTTVGGYYNSEMHQVTLPEIATQLKTVLGTHLLTHRCLLSNAMTADTLSMAGAGWKGASTNWAWYDCEIVLLSEVEVYGSTVLSSSFYDIGEACQQLPVFQFIHHSKLARNWFWLRCVASSTYFCRAASGGRADCTHASNVRGVRPLILLG